MVVRRRGALVNDVRYEISYYHSYIKGECRRKKTDNRDDEDSD